MNRPVLTKLILVVLAVVWLFAVTFNYYIAHKPFTMENVLAMLNALGDVIVAGALYALAAALGRRALRRFDFATPLETILFSTSLGLGILAFATFALGLLGLLNRILFWAILVLVLLLFRGDVMVTLRALRSIQLPMETRMERGLALFCGFAIALAFLIALTPPVAWDALQYHLIAPQLAIAQGRIAPPPDNVSLNYPSLVEMLFLAAMLLKGDIATQLMHWGYLLLMLGAVMAFAQKYFSIKTGWLAAALLLAVPSLLMLATWAYNDLALIFYGFAALMLTLRGLETKQTRVIVLAGIFAGMAMGEKYTAAIVPLALVALLVRPRREALVQTIAFGISAAVVAAPWYIRNWIFVGNPVYPFVWGGADWDAFRAAWYSRFGTGLMNEPLRLLAVPWDATVSGNAGSVDFQATIAPLLLALLPLTLLTLRSEIKTRSIATHPLWFFAAVLYVFWLLGVVQSKLLWQTRLLFPAFPALALLAADAFERLSQLTLPQFSLQRFTALVIGLVLGLTALSYGLSFIADHPLSYIVGAESRQEFRARHLGDYDTVARFVNQTLPADAKIFFLWETRAYYFKRAVNADAILDRLAHLRYQYHEADNIAQYLRREGYTHVLLNRAGLDLMLQTGYDPITMDDAQTLQELAARHLKLIYGKTPLQITTRDGKPAILGAVEEPYAVYEILAREAAQ